MLPFSSQDIYAILPMLIVMITGMLVLLLDVITPPERKGINVFLSIVGVALSGVASAALWDKGYSSFGGSIVADNFALLFQIILLVVVAMSVLLSEKYIEIKGINHGEYYALMLLSASGAMLMAASRELITIFIGLEILSIALYVLSGFARTEPRSEESAMKYFLLGSFSSAFFLYGIALIYGGAGTTRLDMMVLSMPALAHPYTLAGMALLIVGLGFKAAIVPFHMWTPDVYEGAPTSVTAFMSAGAKAGAFAAFIRVAGTFLPVAWPYHVQFHDALWVLAILTMLTGNILAAVQTNIKRLMAYSSIAHAGYILVGLLAQNAEGQAGVLFYMVAYTFMNLGAFGVIILLARKGEELTTVDDLRGLAARYPGPAAFMALFMLSLGGIPPTAGFMGKLYLFLGAVHAHMIGLAVVGLLSSVIGVFYYLRVIVSMYFQPEGREYKVADYWSVGATAVVTVAAVMTLVLGIIPGVLYPLALSGATSLTAPPAMAYQPAPPPLSVAVRPMPENPQ